MKVRLRIWGQEFMLKHILDRTSSVLNRVPFIADTSDCMATVLSTFLCLTFCSRLVWNKFAFHCGLP